jgi:hypothetical protein
MKSENAKIEKPFANYTEHLRDQAALQTLNGMVMQRIPSDAPMRASYARMAYEMADALLNAREPF